MHKELLRLERINKSYDGRKILEDLDLTIHENEFVTLLGPSGCGKTTILRLMGGFERPDSGKIRRPVLTIISWRTGKRDGLP